MITVTINVPTKNTPDNTASYINISHIASHKRITIPEGCDYRDYLDKAKHIEETFIATTRTITVVPGLFINVRRRGMEFTATFNVRQGTYKNGWKGGDTRDRISYSVADTERAHNYADAMKVTIDEYLSLRNCDLTYDAIEALMPSEQTVHDFVITAANYHGGKARWYK